MAISPFSQASAQLGKAGFEETLARRASRCVAALPAGCSAPSKFSGTLFDSNMEVPKIKK